MAGEHSEAIRARLEDLSKNAFLDVLLPRAPDFDAAAILEGGSPEDLGQAPSRRHLFFGAW